jgi:uncharacterized protein (DUF736 family)
VATNQQPSAGGVWKRIDRNGNEYFYFQVEIKGFKYTFRAFPNKSKQKDTHPDYRLFAVDEPVEVKKWEPKPRVGEKERKVTPPPDEEANGRPYGEAGPSGEDGPDPEWGADDEEFVESQQDKDDDDVPF